VTENLAKDLAWGGVVRDLVLDGTKAVWGARAILTGGYVDLLGNRMEMLGDETLRRELVDWLDTVAIKGLRENVQRWWDAGQLDGRTTTKLIGYHDDTGTIFVTPNGSHGYLYIVAFLEAHLADDVKTRGLDLYIEARYAEEADTTA
jgi:hypothetical protein